MGLFFLFAVGVTALIIGAVALSTINSYVIRTTVTETVLTVQGVCPLDTTIPVRFSKTGGSVLLQVPWFYCDGTANTSLGDTNLYMDLPVAFRPKLWDNATANYVSIDTYDTNGEPWVSTAVPFFSNGTVEGSTAYILTSTVTGVPRLYLGTGLDDAQITPDLGGYGPQYDFQLRYQSNVNGAGAGRVGVMAAATALVLAL